MKKSFFVLSFVVLILALGGFFSVPLRASAQQATTTATSTALSVSSIPSFNDMNVPLGTARISIGLPTSTIATLNDSSTESIPIFWNFGSPLYNNGALPGTYGFVGTLLLTDSSTTNPNNLTAHINVIVATSSIGEPPTLPSNIVSIASTTDINVPNGTASTSLSLPASVGVTLNDSSTSSVPVIWNGGTPPYNGNIAGLYAFSGTLTLTGSTTNTNNLKAAVNVVVASSTATSTATSTPSTPTPPSTSTSTQLKPSFNSGSIEGGRRHPVGGEVLGASTSSLSDLQQQLLSVIQQLISLFRNFQVNLK